MNKISLVIALGLVACGGGLTEEEFGQQVGEVTCDKLFECMGDTTLGFFGWTSVEDCYAAGETTGTPPTGTSECANFDSAAAQACLDAWDAVTCEDMTGGTGTVALSECDSAAICGA